MLNFLLLALYWPPPRLKKTRNTIKIWETNFAMFPWIHVTLCEFRRFQLPLRASERRRVRGRKRATLSCSSTYRSGSSKRRRLCGRESDWHRLPWRAVWGNIRRRKDSNSEEGVGRFDGWRRTGKIKSPRFSWTFKWTFSEESLVDDAWTCWDTYKMERWSSWLWISWRMRACIHCCILQKAFSWIAPPPPSSTTALSWPLRVHLALQTAKAIRSLRSSCPPIVQLSTAT